MFYASWNVAKGDKPCILNINCVVWIRYNLLWVGYIKFVLVYIPLYIETAFVKNLMPEFCSI